MRRTVILGAAALAAAPGLALADDLSGTWRVEITAGAEPVVVLCNFAQRERSLGGTCAREGGDDAPSPLYGRVEGQSARWSYDVVVQGIETHIAFDGAVEGTTITGHADYGGVESKFAALKK